MKTASISATVLLVLSSFAVYAQQVSVATPPANISDADAAESAQPAAMPNGIPNGVSEARIVRLSQVKGLVQLNRNTDKGFETAFPNLPITQGQALQTAKGVAEVEFEDDSSLRIATDSLIEFPALQRGPSGDTITTVKLLKGTLYVSLEKAKGNQFNVIVGDRTIVLTPSTHIRLVTGANATQSELAVYNGSAQLVDASGTTTVDKKKALLFDADTQAAPVVTTKVQIEDFDQWDKGSADYHNVRAASYLNGSPTYGINDLNYYGSFINSAGCGTMWRPYFASAAWDPYSNGIWAWYPGSGYSWVSPYPWGWTPYHTGSWAYCATGGGWGWRPGGPWRGLRNHPTTLTPNQGPATHNPNWPKPPHSPIGGHPTSLIAYNTRPLSISHLSAENNAFVFNKDSAGLGVPRESLGKLNRVSAGVMEHGSVSQPIFIREPNTVHDASVAGGANRTNNSPSSMARSSNTYTHNEQASHGNSTSSAASHSSSSFSSSSSSGGSFHGSSSSSSMSSSAPSSASFSSTSSSSVSSSAAAASHR